MQFKINQIFFISFFCIAAFSACKKSDIAATTSTPATTTSAADSNLVKDSALMYAQQLYLWYNQIPSNFNARSYSDPNAIMTAIRAYSIEPGFSTAVDKWSFGMKQVDWNNLSSGIGANISATTTTGDFGLGVFFYLEGDLRVKSVEKESPAGIAGIRRSWRITKINGSTNITTSNATFIVNAVYYSTQSTFTFIKPDGTSVDITLTTAQYKQHPVFLDTVYTINSKKIGYLVFNSFLGDTTEISNEFNRVFNEFSSANVSDVVVDLRYNGGGYISASAEMANYLAPSSASNNLMMKQQYNDKNSAYNTTTYFQKLGSLNLSRIFFIVTNATASASELLINNLKSYMTVKLVGPSATDGKPVGFFPIPDGDWYVFPVSFRSTNASGVGNYFNGFTPDALVADGLNKDWGDITESSLASAIKYITTGAFRLSTGETFTDQIPQVKTGNLVLNAPFFKGAVSTQKRLK